MSIIHNQPMSEYLELNFQCCSARISSRARISARANLKSCRLIILVCDTERSAGYDCGYIATPCARGPLAIFRGASFRPPCPRRVSVNQLRRVVFQSN